ncbi:efflux RND transporter periplasmic adaptor subunit [Simiduia curdlanivorans]|uniref:Efflux RND transporter periplasmic adaptor subunit n=1 Tax=Simiduia curdlanivorans TaxID=1492769 RepID=A0ABV8V5D6_9GAMM|nr:efflux RND transporter periplasmic adaptor subunit [Simiduia curdlanivorans]MDN3638355.1 efflux RND transporter periplasmic adaptor subunit [Simiduia curdlanivorans]
MNSNDKNTTDLLSKLSIDRSKTPEASGFSNTTVAILVLAAALTGAGLSYVLTATAPSPTSKPISDNSAPSSAAKQQEIPAAPKPSAINSAVLNASGYITARRMATVSAEVMGLIKTVEVEEGMAVQEHQILARLDDTLARVSLQQAQAQTQSALARVDSLSASLEEAQRQYRRAQENKYSSELEKTQAVTNLATAKANLAGAKSDLAALRFETQRRTELVDDHIIRAPFSGVVTVKNAQPGEIVAPSSAGGGFTRTGICTIVDMTSLEIEVDVNEAFIGRVSPQQMVKAQLDAYPDWEIPASVIAIIPTADRGKATVRVRIQIDATDERILPDMGVKVAFY